MKKILLFVAILTLGLAPALARQSTAPAQPPAESTEDSNKKLKVVFLGGDFAGNLAQVLMRLKQQGVLEVDSGSPPEGMTAAQAYARKLDLPQASAALTGLAETFNQKVYGEMKLSADEVFLYPDVDVDPYEVVKTYDLSAKDDVARLENDRRQWAGSIVEYSEEKSRAKLKLRAYELKAHVADPQTLNRLIDEIKKIAPAEIRVTSRKMDAEHLANVFTVALEGGDTTKDAGQVLKTLVKLRLVKLRKHTVVEGDTVESVYKEALKIPASLIDLAGELNDTNYRRRSLRPGEELLLPAISFERYQWTKMLNLQSAEDKAELARMREHWDHVTVTESLKSPDVVQVELAGYKVSVAAGSAEKLKEAHEALRAISSRNVVLSFPPTQTAAPAAYYARAYEDIQNVTRENLRPDLWWDDCCVTRKEMEEGKQGWIGDYIGMPGLPEIEKNCSGPQCPQIVLLDVLPELHPDIAAAIIDDDDIEGSSKTLVGENRKQMIAGGTFNDKDHGTHLVGIIASQDNDFGIIGINPRVRIFPINWEELRNEEPLKLARKINDRARRENDQIWVFASFWELALKKDVLTSGDERLQDVRVKRIKETGTQLWITAAGQGTVARPISRFDRMTPMNLGDLPNVVVVTACEGCYGSSPHIESHSNYSASGERMVHLAAPGQEVPSTVASAKYAKKGGTSQAMAFVAGVASAMMSGYPEHYRRTPSRVKFRLQITARPSLTGDEASRVAAGILDPTLALLNPVNNYVDATGKMEPFSPKGWCARRLDIQESGTGNVQTVQLEKVHRLVRTQGNEWVIYYSDDPLTGEVIKVGPGTITDPDRDSALLLKTDNKTLTLNQFSDLLLSLRGLKPLAAGCPK